MRETAVLFGEMKSLVGVLTDPPPEAKKTSAPGIILLNPGIVHRVGLNRLHVKMARRLAEIGFMVFRFDFSGIGDSKTREDHLPFFEGRIRETQEAMDYLAGARGIDRFVLLGICSGAAISYKTACRDPRVVGAVLINGRGHLGGDDEEQSLYVRERALKRHYWRILLSSSFSAKNWWKAMTGKVEYGKILRSMLALRLGGLPRGNHDRTKVVRGLQDSLARVERLAERGVRLFVIHSEGDEGLDYLHIVLGGELQRLINQRVLKLETIAGADHIFTLLWSQEHLLNLVYSWAREIAETARPCLSAK